MQEHDIHNSGECVIETQTFPVKYVFLDVVGFTSGRSVESQYYVIDRLNDIVLSCIEEFEIPQQSRLLIPTGDGICIALLDVITPYDIHVQMALRILGAIEEHSSQDLDGRRKFQVRIGINSYEDTIVQDINEQRNIAGAGINMAQKIMSLADGGNILVGQTVFDALGQRERYMSSFTPYATKDKHGNDINVYQYTENGKPGLNADTPRVFENEIPILTKIAAYFFGHAIKNRQFFDGLNSREKDYTPEILLWFLAKDSVAVSEAAESDTPILKTHKAGEVGLGEQFKYYLSIDRWMRCELYEHISKELSRYRKCMESNIFGLCYIAAEGREKLKKEWPEIWEEFALE